MLYLYRSFKHHRFTLKRPPLSDNLADILVFTILDQSQQYILQRPGIDHIGHFSLPSGPLDAKVHTHSTMTNLFYIYLYFTKDFTQKYK